MTVRVAAAAALAFGASLFATADPSSMQSNTTTLTGCVRTGSNASVFLLRGAATPSAESVAALPEDFLIASVPNSVNLADHVNHRVQVAAVVTDPKGPPAAPGGANAAERALKRLTVRELKEVAPNCAK